MRLRPRRRPLQPCSVGNNIRHLDVLRVAGKRIHLRFCPCRVDSVVVIEEPSYLCSTCPGSSVLTEESLESLSPAFPCVIDWGSEAACSEAPSIGKPRKHKVCHIAFNDLVQTIEVPYSWEHDLWGGDQWAEIRKDGEPGPIWKVGDQDPMTANLKLRGLISGAQARQRAIEHASGLGCIIPIPFDEDMRGEDWIDVTTSGVTFGARQHKNETRLPVLLHASPYCHC